jgi:motility quorum-sensing regulator / GCU-specific mRNA interferase toxin
VTSKRKPHHGLVAIQAKFADVESLEITGTALRGAQAIGYSLEDVVDVVQALQPQDFVKSETAHNPPNHRVWHDTYVIPFDDMDLYLKFAGETLVDIVLTSFKEILS